ncbi:MAG: GNAT family N-acetyltransferase, partial [Chlamydiae bacterium]|nr:GNAT family N-acetyltransferase [Chlamydiota bacterium]
MVISTSRLTIRKFTLEDLDAFSKLMGNKEVMRFSVAGSPLSLDQARGYLQRNMEHYAEHGFGMWAIIHTADNCLIGSAGLMMQTIDGTNLVELAYRFDPSYWGKGLAVEAAAAIVEYGFRELHLDQVIAI